MRKGRTLLQAVGLLALVQVVTFLWARRLRGQYLAQPVDPNMFNLVVVTDGKDEKIASRSVRGGFIRVIMGGLELDLRDVKLQQRPAVVETTIALGGLDMKVPGTWTVDTDFAPSIGGVANHRPRPKEGQSPDLLLRGKVIFGGVNIE